MSEIALDQAISILPVGLRQCVLAEPRSTRVLTEEVRLRVGCPLMLTMPEGERELDRSPILTAEDLYTTLEIATQASLHAEMERIRQGFLTVKGGHRIGLCGSAVIKNGEIYSLRDISSLNLRIARHVVGIGDRILAQLYSGGHIPSVLILAPPGAGKTTLLRDLIRSISSGYCGCPMRVGVVDERGEVGAVYQGVPQFDLGPHTDIMDGCSKADGAMMLLRGMNPQVLAMDEITAPGDIDALEHAAGCGVTLLATAHGSGVEDLRRRPLYARLMKRNIFQKLLIIEQRNGMRTYRLEALNC